MAEIGNPTKSTRLNNLVQYIKRRQVCSQGVPSRAQRTMTHDESSQPHSLIKTKGEGFKEIYGILAMINFQYHMIDILMIQRKLNLRIWSRMTSLLSFLGLQWISQRFVLEKQDAPFQFIIAANNPMYCVHLSLAVWLDTFLSESAVAAISPYVFTFSDDMNVPNGGDKSKNYVQKLFMTKSSAMLAFKIQQSWEVTPCKILHQLIVKTMVNQRIRKIYVVVGRAARECHMTMKK